MSLKSFWAVELVPGKDYTTTPDFDLRVTQAVLPLNASDKGRTIVTVACPDEPEEEGQEVAPAKAFTIASLKTDVADSQQLDLTFDGGLEVTFSVHGKNPVHLTGYLVPPEDDAFYSDDDEEIESEDEDDELGLAQGNGFGEESDEEEEADEQFITAALEKKRKAGQQQPHQNGAPAPKKPKQEQAPKQEQQPKQPKQQNQPKQKEHTPTKEQTPKQEQAPKQGQTPKQQPEGKKNQEKKPQTPNQNQQKAETRVLEGGLQVTTLREGTGAVAKAHRRVSVKYVGRLQNGKIFDKATDHHFPFNLGAREVISGWDMGIVGMKEGEVRKLVIPPKLAYGAAGAGPSIPPNATLTFEVELIKVK